MTPSYDATKAYCEHMRRERQRPLIEIRVSRDCWASLLAQVTPDKAGSNIMFGVPVRVVNDQVEAYRFIFKGDVL